MEQARALTVNETDHILKTTLTSENYADPYIIHFITQYLASLNVAESAKACGLKPSQGYNIMRLPDVVAALAKLNQKSVSKYGTRVDSLVRKVEEISEINLFDALNDDGTVKSRREMPVELQRAFKKFKVREVWEKDINGVETKTGRIVEFEVYDKLKSIELLGRQEDAFVQKTKVEHDVGKNAAAVLLGSLALAGQRVEALGMREVAPQLAAPTPTEGVTDDE